VSKNLKIKKKHQFSTLWYPHLLGIVLRNRSKNKIDQRLFTPIFAKSCLQINLHRQCQVASASASLGSGNCDDGGTLCDDSQWIRARVDCTEDWGYPGRIVGVGYCGCWMAGSWGHPPPVRGVQMIHLPTLGGCDPPV